MRHITINLVNSLNKVKKENSSPAPDALFDLTSFLAVSARGTLEEGVYCGSLRLIDAIRKAIRAYPNATNDPFLAEMSIFIDSKFENDYLESEEKYIAFLDEIVAKFADEILKRNGVEQSPLSENKRGEQSYRNGVAKNVIWKN
jgi:hypothetical protein